jgi:heterodisulfide reductase subunit A-like polyferredoxin
MALADPNTSERALAKRFGITPSSMHRHATTHVPKVLASMAERIGVLESDQLLAQTLGLYERTLELLADAESNVARAVHPVDRARALAAATGAIRETRHVLDTLAKVNLIARQELSAAERPDSIAENVRADLDEEIAERLRRRGMASTGVRAEASSKPAPMLALPAPDESEVVEAELVD